METPAALDSVQFRVVETFTTRVLGSAPANKEIYAKFIASKKAEAEEKKRKFAERSGQPVQPSVGTLTEEVETLEDLPGVTIFHNDLGQKTEAGEDGRGLFFYDYAVAGYYKEAAEILAPLHGIAMVRSKLDNFMMVKPRRVYITDQEGAVLDKPDGMLERPLRAMTMQGPRVSLAASELVNQNRKIEYVLDFLPYLKSGRGKASEKKDVTLADFVKTLLAYAGRKGRGQWRGGGNGRFFASFEPVVNGNPKA